MSLRQVLFFLVFLCLSRGAFATFSGQNGKIAFSREGEGIYTISLDGSGETALMDPAGPLYNLVRYAENPQWSADGTKIVFFTWRTGTLAIYIMNADGSNLTKVNDNLGGTEAYFSPDGTQLVFDTSHHTIWKMDIYGTNLVELFTAPPDLFLENPVWSPDGSKIAFDMWTDDLTVENIYTINSDGSNLVQLTDLDVIHDANGNTVFHWDFMPNWSPDGTKLVFSHAMLGSVGNDECATDRCYMDLDGVLHDPSYSIVTMNADGSNRVELAASNQVRGFPNWSPDGTKLVISTFNPCCDGFGDGGNGVLYVMNVDGSGLTQLTDDSAYRYWPSIQPLHHGVTPTGNNVVTTPVDQNPAPGSASASLNFSSVTQAGDTSVTSSTSGMAPPSDFKLGTPPVYYDFTTTATFSGPVTLCFSWQDGQFANENKIKLFHYENGAWTNVTTSLDTAANKVCGQTFSLSPFALFEMSYTFTGFFSPVDNPPIRNVAKAGSAIPVKFSLGGNRGLEIFNAGYPTSQQVQCSTSAPLSDVEETVLAGGSSLSYDATFDRYNYVWKTDKSWASTCRRLILKFNEGTIKIAEFSFSK